MPRIQLPNLKLDFLKKLMPKKLDHRAITELVTNIGPDTQRDEKAAVRAVALEECPICHDPVGLRNPEGVLESWVYLHCNHKFGTHCIQTWLQESAERDPHSVPSCPICRSTAKHACGHPVVLPIHRLSPVAAWSSMLPPLPVPSHSTHIESYQRPRRRLVRRWGHPRRPPPPQPPRAYVQTVGECTTCAAEAHEKRLKELVSSNVETGRTAYIGNRTGDKRTVKSMLLRSSSRRRSTSTSSSGSQQREEAYAAFIGVFGEGAPSSARPLGVSPRDSLNLSLTAHRDSLTLCRPERSVPRSPTPIPPVAHVLSTRMALARV